MKVSHFYLLLSAVLKILTGHNLIEKQKLQQMTGNGRVLRKRIHDEGRSLRSQMTEFSDPFSESPSSSHSNKPTGIIKDQAVYYDFSSDSSSPSRDGRKKLVSNPKCQDFDSSFDALFTSSPVGQSTPRIRLEPATDEFGKKKWRKVCADTTSLFDHDESMIEEQQDITMESSVGNLKVPYKKLGGILKSRSTNKTIRQLGFGQSVSIQSMKKHPSPTKEELENLKKTLDSFTTPYVSPHVSKHRHRDSNDIRAAALALKQNDDKLEPAFLEDALRQKETRFPHKPPLTRAAASLPAMHPRSGTSQSFTAPSIIDAIKARVPSRAESRNSHRYSTRNLIDPDDSMMDIDELQ